ncbi:MAG: sulfatase [Akkermansiaceae bacterium]
MKNNLSTNIRRLILLAMVSLSSHAGAAEKPNVLFIAVDDLNDWTGYAGNKQAITPNMDKLASQSVWFSKAYCQYPVCGPSRASLMSGLYFHQLNSPKLQPNDDFVEKTVQDMGSKLLHGYFKQHGYKTMAVGKLLHKHLPDENVDMSGGRGGWDFLKDKKTGKKIKLQFDSQKTLTDWGPWKKPEEKMSDSEAAAWAVERLGEKHDEPFMLMVGFLRPHAPWYVPQKYFDMYDKDKLELPAYKKDDLDDVPAAARETINDGYPRTEWAIETGQWKNIIQGYLASITFVDSKIGQVLDALDNSDYKDNTIIILWSDHGYHMGEKNTFQKHTLWERSGRAPLMIHLPDSMNGKKYKGECEKVVGLIDIYPTLVDLCNLPANDKVVGRSLKPLIVNPKAKWDFPTLTYRKDGGKAVRFHQYRYIEYGDGSQELYDHNKDPNEWKNLATYIEYKSVLEGMKELLTKNHIAPTEKP